MIKPLIVFQSHSEQLLIEETHHVLLRRSLFFIVSLFIFLYLLTGRLLQIYVDFTIIRHHISTFELKSIIYYVRCVIYDVLYMTLDVLYMTLDVLYMTCYI